MRRISIHVEQAVYGSFPFWDRGYAILARSAGCREEWVEEFRAACERFGERPRDVEEASGFFVIRPRGGPWVVVGVGEAGRDDRGRPGALVFHALFVRSRDYRRLAGWPFGLARFHRREWGPETRELDSLVLEVEIGANPTSTDPRAIRIARALRRGRRVAIESEEPIDKLAREVWACLPSRLRSRRSLATWAFGVANRFDLVGLSRRSAVDLGGSYARSEDLKAPATEPLEDHRPSLGFARRWPWTAWGLALVMTLTLLGWLIGSMKGGGETGSAIGLDIGAVPTPPSQELFRGDPLDGDVETQDRVRAGLVELAERFALIEPGRGETEPSISTLMERIARELRYRGPLLTPGERERLRSEPSAGRSRALAWDEHVRRFVPDRPLPSDFTQGPLRWRLETLAWSFHLSLDPRLAPVEFPHALGHALAVEGSVRPNPLTEKYPELGEYERFLRRLPRR